MSLQERKFLQHPVDDFEDFGHLLLLSARRTALCRISSYRSCCFSPSRASILRAKRVCSGRRFPSSVSMPCISSSRAWMVVSRFTTHPCDLCEISRPENAICKPPCISSFTVVNPQKIRYRHNFSLLVADRTFGIHLPFFR
jgi:hypothetical protein